MEGSDIDQIPTNGDANPHGTGGPQSRRDWVRANFTQIFGTSPEQLRARGIDPRQYAREHRDQIRRFAQAQRRQGVAVPGGRPNDPGRQGNNGRGGGWSAGRGYGYRMGGRYGMGMRGGTTWIGILIALLALRFLLVDSFAGPHVAIFWVLGIGGIMLVARVFLFSWLRRRRFNRRQSEGRRDGQTGF
jgi:hypothetical protein